MHDVAREFARAAVRSKDVQKQLARTSLIDCYASSKLPCLWHLLFLPCFFLWHRLEVIRSYSRGHAMMKVADGPPSGTQILEHFGGNRKKKVYLYLPPGKVHVFFPKKEEHML